MASDTSLAAEIEAVIGDPVAVHLNMLRGTIAKPSIENIIHLYGRDALLAALQSRAFEDGARKNLSDALAAYDAAERELTAAEAVHQDVCRRIGDEPDIGEIMQRVGAEQACMRCSMAKGIVRAHLVAAVRDALQTEGERSDAQRRLASNELGEHERG